MADQAEQLKSKYQSVINLISSLGARLQNQHVENGKLVLRAQAKTKSDSNKIWDQIKLVDKNYAADLAAEIKFDTDDSQKAPPAAAAQKTYTVRKGDTLSAIAKQHYGDASEYRKIFAANRDQLSDPDEIKPGQVLKLPA
jgi:nucleoid-associated protein YgaU